MHTLLIIGQNTAQRSSLATKHAQLDLATAHADLFTQEPDETIGINIIRQIKKFVTTAPIVHTHKIIWLPTAENMTTEAQNAFLKTLEEPPGYARILLGAPNTTSLLPTIVSRARIIYTQNPESTLKPNSASQELLNQISQSNLSQAFELAASRAKDRDQALDTVHQLIATLRYQLHHQPSTTINRQLQAAQQTHYRLSRNANPQLSLEHLYLQLRTAPESD